MEIIYTILDKVLQMEMKKKILVSLIGVTALVFIIISLYTLFRSYNSIGLVTLLFIYFILVFRESFLELFEFKKIKKENQRFKEN
jgi:hypothetical protein